MLLHNNLMKMHCQISSITSNSYGYVQSLKRRLESQTRTIITKSKKEKGIKGTLSDCTYQHNDF